MLRSRPILVVLLLAIPSVARAELVSRVPYPPLVEKLKASGGSPDRILHPKRAADLDALESGRRYKLIVDLHRQLAIAPLPADAAANEYVHPILAGGAPVLTAGGIRIDRAGHKITRVVIDQDSKAYCPTKQSLAEAVRALTAAGVAAGLIEQEDRPPECAAK